MNHLHSWRKFILLTLVSVGLTACSSPNHVTASRPLVEQVNYSKRVPVPSQYWAELTERQESFSLKYQQKDIVVGDFYLSAIGSKCRILLVSLQRDVEKRVVCQSSNGQSWYLTPDIIHSTDVGFSF